MLGGGTQGGHDYDQTFWMFPQGEGRLSSTTERSEGPGEFSFYLPVPADTCATGWRLWVASYLGWGTVTANQ